MTALTRFVPLDNLSLLEGSKLATISVHDDRIYLHLQDDDGADGRSFTFEQFYQALHGLLKPVVAPTPSSDDKSPTAATGGANTGTPEFAVGDRVEFRSSGLVGVPTIMQGVIRAIEKDGIAQVDAEGARFFRELSCLKNITHIPTLKVGDEVRWKHSGAVGTLEVVTGARSVAVRHGDGSVKTGHMNELEATL